MSDMNQVLKFIKEINNICEDLVAARQKANALYDKEVNGVKAEAKQLIIGMRNSFKKYCDENFTQLIDRFLGVANVLTEEYPKEAASIKIKSDEFKAYTIEECNSALTKIIEELNSCIKELNAVNFDKLVPPVSIKREGTSFYTYTGNNDKLESYTYESKLASKPAPKLLSKLATSIFTLCARGKLCVETMQKLYTEKTDIEAYEAFVCRSVETWTTERRTQLDNEWERGRYQLLDSADAKNKYYTFFDELYDTAKRANVDYTTGTLTDSEEILLGFTRIKAVQNDSYKTLLAQSEALKKQLSTGELATPVIMDLKECGNILIELNESEEYADVVQHFIEQVIIRFLIAFPANKINFRLIDIAGKVDFGPFNQLTKINPDILFGGIVHDSRKLADAVKDMKELMHSIIDKKLSLNNVKDIFEYNKAFEANQQTLHLLVITDFPNGINPELAKDLLEIVKNGNKAGIFTLIVQNDDVEPSDRQKVYEYERVIDNIKKHALCASYRHGELSLDIGMDNSFEIGQDITVDLLPQIVGMMQVNAESTKKKNVLLETMFEESDRAAKSERGIPSAAEVLDIPIGVCGGEIQTLKLETNGGVSPHAVVIGGTGSGKSNLLHTIILNTCYRYSPEDVNLYLIDFKGGNEFKFYEANKVPAKQIPHIKLTGLTSDVEDGIAILNNLQNVLAERQEQFRKANVSDIVQYWQAGYKMPRLFVIVDEIQELFEQDENLGNKAISILRELFKLGRAYGITILWASQNIPSTPGLRDKVVSQIGNRISLKLNEPDNAQAIQIDPKMVRALNRPEKGLGIIKDSRTGNNCVEFRVAYAENVSNRQRYAEQIVEKWKSVTARMNVEPLFIVGDDDVPVPTARNSVFAVAPTRSNIVSKAFDTYSVQFGQNYITGNPFSLEIDLRANKSNILFMGTDIETVRDNMGYSLLSVAMEHVTNADCIGKPASIYYANGEGVIPKNSEDLFNAVKNDFAAVIDNVSAKARFKEALVSLYKTYKERKEEAENFDEAKAYAPCFFVIHSLQNYVDLFESNAMLQLSENEPVAQPTGFGMGAGNAGSLTSLFASQNMPSMSTSRGSSESVSFVDAFKELMSRAGQFGIHFIISLDSIEALRIIKNELCGFTYKVITKGVNSTEISSVIGEMKNNAINNPEIALVAIQGEKYKVRMFRYDETVDDKWYKDLAGKYLEIR